MNFMRDRWSEYSFHVAKKREPLIFIFYVSSSEMFIMKSEKEGDC